MNRAEKLLTECCRVWAPPVEQTLSEWVEANFILSPEYSAVTGRLRLYEFQRQIFDLFTDPYVREIVVMCSTQMVKTLLLQAIIAYVITCDPGPILLAQPTATDAETFSKERLAPMIRDMECLRTRVAEAKSRDSGNTIPHKVFDGGSLSLIGAQTAGAFARRAVLVFLCDERDKWPDAVGKEGDAFSLGVKRGATFRSRFKIVQVCSPTVEGRSAIAAAFERSDQGKFQVPCPKCGEFQILRWAQVRDPRFPGKQPESTRYECEQCGDLWTDAARWAACERGKFVAEKPREGVAGVWISELYSPWKKLCDPVTDFLAKKDNPVELQTFVNTTLAETFREPGEAPPDAEKLMARREESYRLGQVPEGVLFLTAGVDTQASWLEGYVWGWGRERHRWLVDHWRFDGDPLNAPAWDWLTERLNSIYRTSSGVEIGIAKLAIDTGYAAHTQQVYSWARQQGAHRVLAVDGRATGELVGYPSLVDVEVRRKKISNGAKLWPINVSKCKSELYGLLNRERPAPGEPLPPGWVHFPLDTDEEFFRQLTSERFVMKMVRGVRRGYWEKDGSLRNEALDCYDYARGGAAVEGFDRAADDDWDYLAQKIGVPVSATAARNGAPPAPPRRVEARVPVSPLPPPAARQQQRASSNFMRELLG